MIISRIKEQVKLNPNKLAYVNEFEKITYGELWNNASLLADKLCEKKAPVIIKGDKSVKMIVSILACLISKNTYIPVDDNILDYRLENIKNMINNFWFIDVSKDNILSPDIGVSNDNDIAYIIFTSGTSGNSKGVPISYDNLFNFVNWISNIDGLSNYDNLSSVNVLNQANFSFDLSVADLYFSLCNGHTLVGLSNNMKINYKEMIDYIILNKIDIMVITPTFMKYCMTDVCFDAKLLPSLKTIYFCGEILEKSLVSKVFERFPGVDIINAYGPTEATSAVSSVLIKKDMLNSDILPVGVLDKCAVDIQIINDEIVLKGKSVFDKYLNIVSDKVYKQDNINCYETGDLGYILDGYLYCQGRIDNQIKYNGYRIELECIENVISEISCVNGAVVVPVYMEGKVKFLKAFVESNSFELNDNDIKKYLKEFLPDYMIPRKIVFLDKLPVTSNGKYNRKLLMENV